MWIREKAKHKHDRASKGASQLDEVPQEDIEEERKSESAKALKDAKEIAFKSAVDAFNECVGSIPEEHRAGLGRDQEGVRTGAVQSQDRARTGPGRGQGSARADQEKARAVISEE